MVSLRGGSFQLRAIRECGLNVGTHPVTTCDNEKHVSEVNSGKDYVFFDGVPYDLKMFF